MEKQVIEKMLHAVVEDMSLAANIVHWLSALGYNENFELIGNKLMCLDTFEFFYPRELSVDYLYRLEGWVTFMASVIRRVTLRGSLQSIQLKKLY